MKILAIEGLDKAGKHSYVQEILKYIDLPESVTSEFHRYDTPTGELIRQWLVGDYDVSQETIELIMAADKQAQQEWIQSLEDDPDGPELLILDRYTLSQKVYSVANGIPERHTDNLQAFIRKPDYTVLIDIPAEVSMSRKGKHNDGKNDRYESDLEMLEKVRELYLSACTRKDNCYIVNGEDSIEDVARNTKSLLKKILADIAKEA